MTRQLFLSYAHKDRALFEDIAPRLEALVEPLGWSVWSDTRLPSDIDPDDGDSARALIEPELHRSEAFLVLVSRHMAFSRFIREIEAEGIQQADSEFYTEIVVINLDGTALGDHVLAQYEIQKSDNYGALPEEARAAVLREIADLLATLPSRNREAPYDTPPAG